VDFPGSGRVPDEQGTCACADDTVDIRGKCVETSIFAIAGSAGGLLLVAIVGFLYMRHRNHKADTMWLVNVDELQFDDPVEVIGQGSFGVVLLAEYRGTKVAIKRALRSGDKRSGGSTHGARSGRRTASVSGPKISGSGSIGSGSGLTNEASFDIEADPSYDGNRSLESNIVDSGFSHKSADGFTLGFLGEDFGKQGKWAWLCPWKAQEKQTRFKETILGGGASASYSMTGNLVHRMLPCCSAQAQRQAEFVSEMRVLSRLRHPCITTVMGAVISYGHDPMLVMEYMEYGSLHDLLRNETMYLSGEIIIQIARDIASGLRYLHSSTPAIVHGDLKGRNSKYCTGQELYYCSLLQLVLTLSFAF
jgi:serine/threonine protein kinase